MNPQLTAVIVFTLLFLILVSITQLLYSVAKVASDRSRKFLHVSGGVLALFIPLYFKSHWFVLIICSAAFLLLCFTFYKKMLPSVHQTKRISVGSIIFPLPVYICFVTAEKTGNNMLLYFLPVSLLTLADTMAELGGKKWGHLSASLFNRQKTIAGSLCFAATALIISIVLILFIFKLPTITSSILIVCIPLVTTIAELISFKGYDNLSVPLSALLVLYLFIA
jgi:dolichol kinase